MTTRTWKVTLNGSSHEITLKHRPGPERAIFLDGNIIEKGRVMPDIGSLHHFSIDNHPTELGIISGAWGFEYYLRVDDDFILAGGDKSLELGKITKKIFEQRDKWLKLGKLYGLEYHPTQAKQIAFQHRLIGYVNDCLVLIRPGFMSSGNAATPGIQLILRYADISVEKGKEITNDPSINNLLRKWKVQRAWFNVTANGAFLFLRTISRKDTEEIIFEHIFEFLSIIQKYVKPQINDKCEGIECKMPIGQPLQLVITNGCPGMLCNDCIGNIENVGRKFESEYKKSPNNLLKGFAYGLGGMVLGAVAWALIMIFLDRIGAVFAALIFFLIIRTMDYAKTKRTFFSIFLAGILALIGSMLGTYLGVVGILLKDAEIGINLDDLIWVAKWLLENPDTLTEPAFFALFGIVPYFFFVWISNRNALKKYFKPDVEIVSKFRVGHQNPRWRNQ